MAFTQILDHLTPDLPGLMQAARTVGSQQIRNRYTISGNLGTAPKGICHQQQRPSRHPQQHWFASWSG
ncbi:hypothetical protein ACSNOI_06310 [Actinomadura kijaniata]|uniref:hypothetical protein n=1 Tax=Actinomadura kijaniata TaxID=46161 RepID=UPI003F1B4251